MQTLSVQVVVLSTDVNTSVVPLDTSTLAGKPTSANNERNQTNDTCKPAGVHNSRVTVPEAHYTLNTSTLTGKPAGANNEGNQTTDTCKPAGKPTGMHNSRVTMGCI
jgi:hypothetical protein